MLLKGLAGDRQGPGQGSSQRKLLAFGTSCRHQVPTGEDAPPAPSALTCLEVTGLTCSQPSSTPQEHILVTVDDSIEETAIAPAGGEVVTAQALVALHHTLGPQQQLLFCCHVLRLSAHLNV